MKVFIACVAVLALIGAASALQCFVCNSENDSACEDEFKYDSPALQEAFIKNCTAPSNVTEAEDATEALEVSVTEAEDVIETLEEIAKAAENVPQAFCRKSKIYIESPKSPNTVRVYRDCGFMIRKGYDCYQKRSEDYILDVCQCKDDLCNGSNTLTFSLTSLLALTVPFFTRFL